MDSPNYSYVEVTNTGGALVGWAPGQKRYFTYDNVENCEQATARFLGLSPEQQIVVTSPAPPATSRVDEREWALKDCQASVWSTYVTVSNDEFIYPEGTDPDTPDEPDDDPVITQTVYSSMNPEYFAPALQWSNGKARLVNTANLSGTTWYFRSGQPPLSSLPTSYDYAPNDNISMMVAVANTPYAYQNVWTQKAFFNLKVGPAPTP